MTSKSPYGPVKFESIDQYHASFPAGIQSILAELRAAIREAAPAAKECISYNIPTFKQNKNLVHYAAYKGHIGFYPTSLPMSVFKDELSGYKTSKGTIQFPLDQPMPLALIKRMVEHRVKDDALLSKVKKA
jgi:uncharacterized protein YdhG (YjbR/CyaY superfamily)